MNVKENMDIFWPERKGVLEDLGTFHNARVYDFYFRQ
jgi:hypothetical protein